MTEFLDHLPDLIQLLFLFVLIILTIRQNRLDERQKELTLRIFELQDKLQEHIYGKDTYTIFHHEENQ